MIEEEFNKSSFESKSKTTVIVPVKKQSYPLSAISLESQLA